ncbi:hypothetical protein [Pseudomonas sp. 210_17 TE3656]
MANQARSPTWSVKRSGSIKKALQGPFFMFIAGKKRGGLTRPHFFRSPFVPFHHPDESHPAMSLAFILESLCQSVDTVEILASAVFPSTGQSSQKAAEMYLKQTIDLLFINNLQKQPQ